VIIFDMDGTLIDSVGVWNLVDIELIKRLGGDEMNEEIVQLQRDSLLKEYSSFAQPYIEYCRTLGEKCGSNLTSEEIHDLRYEIADEYLVNVIDYKPFAEKYIKYLRENGYILAIATTTRRKNMDIYRLKNKNINSKAPIDEYFSLVLCREDVAKIKPDPEVFLKVLAEYVADASECIIFEDSLVGVLAANAAGIDVVAVYDKYSEGDRIDIEEFANYYINGFKDVFS